jgi:hypothetical protein
MSLPTHPNWNCGHLEGAIVLDWIAYPLDECFKIPFSLMLILVCDVYVHSKSGILSGMVVVHSYGTVESSDLHPPSLLTVFSSTKKVLF